jgi:ribosome-binding ATPase YchF (GTP1/OBG family)
VAFVARCFVDDDITHVENRIDPLSDLDIIETELMLADLESLEKRKPVNVEKKAKSGGDKEAARHPAPDQHGPDAAARRQARRAWQDRKED